jgi:predicted nuclease of predicted toxin-antitoxin system
VGEAPTRSGLIPRFLVDNDLSPLIVKALEDFEFLHIQSVAQALGNADVDDDRDIIPWLGRTGAIWITHDKAAKRRHAPALKRQRITVLWIRGKKLTNFDHVAVVIRVLMQLIAKVEKAHGPIHFRAGTKTGPTPTIDWAADHRDRSRQPTQRGKQKRLRYVGRRQRA